MIYERLYPTSILLMKCQAPVGRHITLHSDTEISFALQSIFQLLDAF
jgi:hypothetical protein